MNTDWLTMNKHQRVVAWHDWVDSNSEAVGVFAEVAVKCAPLFALRGFIKPTRSSVFWGIVFGMIVAEHGDEILERLKATNKKNYENAMTNIKFDGIANDLKREK